MFNPAHPGTIIKETIKGLREETGQKLTIEEVAAGLGTTSKTLSAIMNGTQSIMPVMAIKLATAYANTTPEFWLKMQMNYDLAQALKIVKTKDIRIFWQAAA